MSAARPKRPKAKQQPSFDVCKRNALGKLDKSPKGSLDEPIAPLVHAINGHPDYVTTSCCSGRISLFATINEQTKGYRGGRWLLVEHATVTLEQLTAALAPALLPAPEQAPVAGSSSAPSADEMPLVLFKHEPGILHVQCRDVEAAKRLLQVALGAGYRESGLVLSQSEKVMLAIRTTSNCLELPVARHGACLLPATYLEVLVAQANERFAANQARTDALHAAFLASCPVGPTCGDCAPEAAAVVEPPVVRPAPPPPEAPAAVEPQPAGERGDGEAGEDEDGADGVRLKSAGRR